MKNLTKQQVVAMGEVLFQEFYHNPLKGDSWAAILRCRRTARKVYRAIKVRSKSRAPKV